LGFSFLFAIYKDFNGYAADAEDCLEYYEEIGSPDFPVFADGASNVTLSQIYNAAPIEASHPAMCALSPEMEILACAAGHNNATGSIDNMFAAIKTHAGL
jgi:hypothetical protein